MAPLPIRHRSHPLPLHSKAALGTLGMQAQRPGGSRKHPQLGCELWMTGGHAPELHRRRQYPAPLLITSPLSLGTGLRRYDGIKRGCPPNHRSTTVENSERPARPPVIRRGQNQIPPPAIPNCARAGGQLVPRQPPHWVPALRRDGLEPNAFIRLPLPLITNTAIAAAVISAEGSGSDAPQHANRGQHGAPFRADWV